MNTGITIGMDMGDKKHDICIVDCDGKVIKRSKVTNTAAAIRKYFGKSEPCRIAMEAGTHSSWISRILEELGYEVLVGNPRKLRAIWDSENKTDERDAEMLARLARFDPKLLYPIHHRGAEAQSDLAIVRSRTMLVETRKKLVSHARGVVKTVGARISKCDASCFHKRLNDEMPDELRAALSPVMKVIEELTEQIKKLDYKLKDLCVKYPETEKLMAVVGVGEVTAVSYVLTLEDHARFTKSRDVGAYVGMVPKRDQSGATDKQLRITKTGDTQLRTLLVNCAHYILGKKGPDCELQRFGLKIASRGGKNAKKRAAVAVARKLAVLLHALWRSDEPYDPFYMKSVNMKAA